MSMRVVTRTGAEFLRGADHALDQGQLTVREWEYAVIDIYVRNQVDAGDMQCGWHRSNGCGAAKWAYLDDYGSTTDEDDQCYGYLCERCAEAEMVIRPTSPAYGPPINLTPLADGVYVPDVHRVIKANWQRYSAVSRAVLGEIWY